LRRKKKADSLRAGKTGFPQKSQPGIFTGEQAGRPRENFRGRAEILFEPHVRIPRIFGFGNGGQFPRRKPQAVIPRRDQRGVDERKIRAVNQAARKFRP
jgi:hypothetical protein